MPKTTRLRKSAQGKRMTMFKSYSPLPALPPGCAGNEVEGGKKHTNRQTISGGGKESRSRAEAWSKHFQRHFLIEKICFHCSVISEYVGEGGREREREDRLELGWWGDELADGQQGEGSMCVSKAKEEVTEREFFNRRMQSGLTTKLVAERANSPQH